MPARPGDLDLRPFDLETGMRVASEVGNFHSQFRHAKPSSSRSIRYVREERTDIHTNGWTKATLIVPFPTGGANCLAACAHLTITVSEI